MTKYTMDVNGNIIRTPRNTTEDMKTESLVWLADAMGAVQRGEDPNEVAGRLVEQQEARGQRELVNSTTLPTKYNGGTREEYEAMGIVFGAVVEGDPMFQEAHLPEGWKREATLHSMWSRIVDDKGEERVSIFYKAAFYDRDAFMNTVAQCTTCNHSATAHPYKGRVEDPEKSSWDWDLIPMSCEREACSCPEMALPVKTDD